MKKIAIIILNYNGEKDTIECIESIAKLSNVNCKPLVIIVDNGSKKEFKFQNLKLEQSKVKTIRTEKNLGFTGGNNLGIKYALNQKSDYIMILNNDTILDKNIVDNLINCLEKNHDCGIVSPKIYFEKGFEFHKDRYKKSELGRVIWYAGGKIDWNNIIGFHKGVDEVDNGQYEMAIETDFATGCCAMIKKEVFEKVGLLDEKYYLYYEDNDFSQKAKKAGFSIFFCPKGIMWHKNAGSVGGSGSNLQDYYITRNRLLFGIRHAPLRSKIALLRQCFSLLVLGRPWQKRGIRDYLLRRFGKGSYKT